MAQGAREKAAERLTALRRLMAQQQVDVYLVPSADEHQNEYLPAYKRRREALSGFTGSAGDLAVLAEQAHLFVDSRYHLQADQEADPALFQVHKLGLAGVLDWVGWLGELERQRPLTVGCDPFVLSVRAAERLRGALRNPQSRLQPLPGNWVDEVWGGRPPRPSQPAYALADSLTGEPTGEKLRRVREAMTQAQAGVLMLSKLDEVAWLTNLRGADIPYNPVFEAYLIVETTQATCFTDTPVPPAARQTLERLIRFRPYGELATGLAQALAGLAAGPLACWMDRDGTSEGVRLLAGNARLLLEGPNPVARLKAIKNPVEIQCSREAHVKAGAAKVRSLADLAQRLAQGQAVSEADYASLLEEEYRREQGFADLSFNTIAAFGANGAIVHYGTPDPAQRLRPGGMLLVDSGVQILGATTDDTRTVAVGEPDAGQRAHYTDVLRGHIRLAMQVFPEGTTGQMLDALARSPLWNQGADYGHGTGHGVGAFLNVHEGPQSISLRGAVPLEPGMIVSNEPGYYRAGWGGIRLENLYVVEEALGLPPHPAGKRWLRLSPLTLIPFDQRLLDGQRLAPEERAWLSAYHAQVWAQLAPVLPDPARQWLRQACQPS